MHRNEESSEQQLWGVYIQITVYRIREDDSRSRDTKDWIGAYEESRLEKNKVFYSSRLVGILQGFENVWGKRCAS